MENQRKLISASSHLQQALAQTGPLFANARNKALISSDVPRALDQGMAAIRLDLFVNEILILRSSGAC